MSCRMLGGLAVTGTSGCWWCGVVRCKRMSEVSHQKQDHVIASVAPIFSCVRPVCSSHLGCAALALRIPLLLRGWVRAAALLPRAVRLVAPIVSLGFVTIPVLACSAGQDSRLGQVRDTERWVRFEQYGAWGVDV